MDMRNKFVKEDEGSNFVDFEDCAATVEVCEIDRQPSDVCGCVLWLPERIRQRFPFVAVQH